MRTIDLKFIGTNKHIFNHKKCVFVVGAGVSVGSGIPDFRSPTGIFATLKQQLKMHGRNLFMYNFGIREGSRKIYLGYISSLKKLCDKASPNETHRFLASYPRSRTYTQNIDGLEEKAGMAFSKHSSTSGVYLHGNLSYLVCQYCGFRREFNSEDVDKFESAEEIECNQCQERREHCLRNGMRRRPAGYMHPGIIHYQQVHPEGAFIGKMCERDMDCDLLVVIGTSLTVDGVKKLVKMFSRCPNVQGKRILVNLTPPNKEWNDVFDFFFHGDCRDFAREVSSLNKTKVVDSSRISTNTIAGVSRGEDIFADSKRRPVCSNISESLSLSTETCSSGLGPENTIDKTDDNNGISHVESGLRRISVSRTSLRSSSGIGRPSLENRQQNLSRAFSDKECISKAALDDVLKNATPTDIRCSTFTGLEEEISSIVSKSVAVSDLEKQQTAPDSVEKNKKNESKSRNQS